jgi:protein O-GlcNAc transferase
MIWFLKIFLSKFIFFLNLKKINHTLSDKIIISFTSYHKRFKNLDLTIESLLNQSLKYHKLILWLASEDYEKIPKKILKYQKHGLEIKIINDLKSYNKIIHAVKYFPDYYIVTADDDMRYKRTWLYELISSWNGSFKEVVCHRAHEIIFDNLNHIKPYLKWNMNIQTPMTSKFVFPLGVGGVLYPPNCFDKNVINENEFLNLCPMADDIWLYWMCRVNNIIFKKTSYSPKKIKAWEYEQQSSLMSYNWKTINILGEMVSNNDIQLFKLNNKYPLFKIDKKYLKFFKF